MTRNIQFRLAVLLGAFCATSTAVAKPIQTPQPSVTGSGYISFPAPGGSITCPNPIGDYNRLYTLGAATACFWNGDVNPDATDVNTLEPTWDDWVEVERDTSTADPGSSFLSTNAAFDVLPTDKAWYLSSSFWYQYGQAVIAIKVGGGRGSPDWMGFVIAPGATSGTFSVSQLTTANGGGLSNLVLFGRGTAYCTSPTQPGCNQQQVPEPGTLALLGISLVGMWARRRRGR